jgi:hypothetical protein
LGILGPVDRVRWQTAQLDGGGRGTGVEPSPPGPTHDAGLKRTGLLNNRQLTEGTHIHGSRDRRRRPETSTNRSDQRETYRSVRLANGPPPARGWRAALVVGTFRRCPASHAGFDVRFAPLKESFSGAVRRRTFICCLNVQISASSSARDRSSRRRSGCFALT